MGVEIAPVNRDELLPGEESQVTLRLWAPLAQVPRPEAGVRFYEGDRLVAFGAVSGVIEADGA